jgi:peptidoglycan/LPS O-acetylase OafA/YrhL
MTVDQRGLTSSRHRTGYLPGLDGWRALAIISVLLTHDIPYFFSYEDFGGYGVYLFFAISGILICTRILEEEAAVGRFRLGAFYIRRLFRIQPAALVYLSVIALFIAAGIIHESWHFWKGALFLYTNYIDHLSVTAEADPFTGHFWTLSVEEHFYILLSLLLFTFRKHRIKIFAAIIGLIWVLQRLAIQEGMFSFDVSPRRTTWVILYLLTPSFLALLLRVPRVRNLAEQYLHPWVAYLVTSLLMLLDRLVTHHRPFWSLRGLLSNQRGELFFGFALCVIATMLHRRSLSTRLLELAPLKFLGRISYSVYLWHVLFFLAAFPDCNITWPPLHFLAARPWKYIASLAFAIASYYLIE